MLQLIEVFQSQNWKITYTSTASKSDYAFDLSTLGIDCISIQLNDSDFDNLLKRLQPTIVIFDRFITEEQFGWRVAEQCPLALRILDTEDLHFLRKARQQAVTEQLSVQEANLYSDTAKREIASIFRCDLSLIISEVEKELLEETFNVPSQIVHYLPFLVAPISEEEQKQLPKFKERKDFVTVGNLLHAPNVDSVKELKKHIWPQIQKQLPDAQMLVYGAYAPQQILELHNVDEGFLIKGWAPDISVVLKTAKICLAPLRFGAGLKGKLLDAMRYGIPSVTTTIGAEGMCGALSFPGHLADDNQEFVAKAVQLYKDESSWNEFHLDGFEVIEKRFLKSSFSETFNKRLEDILQNIDTHRKVNFVGQMLLHHSNQASKYMSKWIEEKNRIQ
jgi:glycosyltransferase involved in cell wall biosynthesis